MVEIKSPSPSLQSKNSTAWDMSEHFGRSITLSSGGDYCGYSYRGSKGFHGCAFMTCEVGINSMSYGNIYMDLPGLTQQLKYRTYTGQKNKLHLLTSPLGSIRSGTHFEPVSSPVKNSSCSSKSREGREICNPVLS